MFRPETWLAPDQQVTRKYEVTIGILFYG